MTPEQIEIRDLKKKIQHVEIADIGKRFHLAPPLV
ncbi:hypothetical protein SAMN05421579_1516 [Xenorhabdus japonica]|uniref:Uncharacterized protein n=1 Tax=Xenorhabdus japonica TaxID=53341 RepID=A0A1I5E1J1_9GAMM|nr:hypothetical protein SAMN05421579_1516 [Xenorhabdus japonica]